MKFQNDQTNMQIHKQNKKEEIILILGKFFSEQPSFKLPQLSFSFFVFYRYSYSNFTKNISIAKFIKILFIIHPSAPSNTFPSQQASGHMNGLTGMLEEEGLVRILPQNLFKIHSCMSLKIRFESRFIIYQLFLLLGLNKEEELYLVHRFHNC